MGILNARYTKEEKEEFARVMLDKLHDGEHIIDIAENLGIANSDAHRIKNKLIEERKND